MTVSKTQHGSDDARADSQMALDTGSAEAIASIPSKDDLDLIWSRNLAVPKQVRGCVHHLIASIAASQPTAQAVCAWDGSFTYAELETLANEVACRIHRHGVQPRSCVPILFSKSKWTPIAMLGVIKAGCSAIALDATQPDSRLRSIIHQAQPTAILASAAHHDRARLLGDVGVLQIGDGFLQVLEVPQSLAPSFPTSSPDDIIYISFTS